VHTVLPDIDIRCLSVALYREFGPVFEEVAASWSKAPKKERDGHFFATLDFSDGQEVFRRVSTRLLYFVVKC